MKIEESKLIEDLKRVRELLGKIPSRSDYNQHGTYSRSTAGRTFGTWNEALKKAFGETLAPSPSMIIQTQCKCCGNPITRSERQIQQGHIFCSIECSNKTNPRRTKTKKCKKCEGLINSQFSYCKTCRKACSLSNKTIKEVVYNNDANKYGVIRYHARNVTKEIKSCEVCEYSKHVETCHIKSIPDFSEDTLISVVNSLDNLLVLCPNCHWEFDENLIEKERLPERLQKP